MRRIHAVVRGRVQGVGFRAATAEEAGKRGLSGWVRNLRDGGVELEAEGPDEAIESLLAFLKVGPWGARVDDLGHKDLVTVGGGGRFEIRH